MNFNLRLINSTNIEKDIKTRCYMKMAEVQKKYPNAIRATGLVVGLASFIGTVAARVSFIAELIIKGLANILMSPFSDKASFSQGIKFTVGLIFFSALTPISIIASAMGVFKNI